MSDNGEDERIQQSQLVSLERKDRSSSPYEEMKTQSETQKDDVVDEELIERLKSYESKIKGFNYTNLCKLPNFIVKHSKDRSYFGQYFNKQKQGKGVLLFDNGRIYEGHWENDRRHGYGYEYFSSGATYVGYYTNNKPHGMGKYNWPNGEVYEGEWSNGTKHGNGMWIGIKKDKYVGEWQCGKPHGQGVHTWINGDRYEGEFSECLKQGYGIERFGNGDTYEGSYSNGKPEGQGKYSWADGSVFKGQFQNGLRCGNGEYIGAKYSYKGQYMNDTKNGQGVFTYPDGRIYRGNFFQDQKDGEGTLELQDGTKIKQLWKMGKLMNEEQPLKEEITTPISFKDHYSILRSNHMPQPPQTRESLIQTLSSQSQRYPFKARQTSPKPTEISSSHGTSKPPNPRLSVQSQRTNRIKSEYRNQNVEDFLLFTNTSMQRQALPPAPMTKRPNPESKGMLRKARDITPDATMRMKENKLAPKPEFSLRFEQQFRSTFKTSTGLKGIRPPPQNENQMSKVKVRIRSVSGSMSGQIRQQTNATMM